MIRRCTNYTNQRVLPSCKQLIFTHNLFSREEGVPDIQMVQEPINVKPIPVQRCEVRQLRTSNTKVDYYIYKVTNDYMN